MNLNELLLGKGFDPRRVLVLRHRPHEPTLNKVLPWLASEKPHVFNAYQQMQGEKLERVMSDMTATGYGASFIGTEPGKALFVGLYAIGRSKPLTYDGYWKGFRIRRDEGIRYGRIHQRAISQLRTGGRSSH
jgi:hypothetical protein